MYVARLLATLTKGHITNINNIFWPTNNFIHSANISYYLFIKNLNVASAIQFYILKNPVNLNLTFEPRELQASGGISDTCNSQSYFVKIEPISQA